MIWMIGMILWRKVKPQGTQGFHKETQGKGLYKT